MERGTVLYTKDGRRTGNAVVLETRQHDLLGEVYVCRTDFGNTITPTKSAIEETFYIGEIIDVNQRNDDQANLLKPVLLGETA